MCVRFISFDPIPSAYQSLHIFWEQTTPIFVQNSRSNTEGGLRSHCCDWNTQQITCHCSHVTIPMHIIFPPIEDVQTLEISNVQRWFFKISSQRCLSTNNSTDFAKCKEILRKLKKKISERKKIKQKEKKLNIRKKMLVKEKKKYCDHKHFKQKKKN